MYSGCSVIVIHSRFIREVMIPSRYLSVASNVSQAVEKLGKSALNQANNKYSFVREMDGLKVEQNTRFYFYS